MNRIETVKLDTLVPYWRNPRKNELAIEKVKASIQEYGYQSLIVVDNQMTIIVGHSRYRALRELGWTEATVVITDMPVKKAKEYRIIDNRTSEYSEWTDDLALELKEFTNLDFRDLFFPDIELDPTFKQSSMEITQENVDNIEARLQEDYSNASNKRELASKINIPCPYCSETITLLRSDVMKQSTWNEK